MKKILLATSVLAATTGFAAAEVTVSGDARMGIISGFADDPLTAGFDESDIAFTSRARVKFSMVGTTDGGVEFGASLRADNSSAASSGDAGEVYVSANGFRLAMGDVDGAANAAVGHVAGVGLTGLSDLNESTFIANGDGVNDPSALASYTSGAITGYFSVTNPGATADDKYSVAVKYAADAFSVALGYEDNGAITHIILGGSYTAGPVTLAARYGQADLGAVSEDQYAVSATYTAGAVAVTAFYANDEDLGGAKAYGLGASYDLGGGASIIGGYAKNQTTDADAFDLGISMSF
jgi:outer membrane protein OmpU